MKIAVGLSGGVDSAVCAWILKNQGYQVIGIFMKNWSDDFGLEGDCPWEEDMNDAESVSRVLGIDFISYNFELEYRNKVISYFFNEYKSGRTPNPDILCNSEIKFEVFLNKAMLEVGVDKIATGHYAKVLFDEYQNLYRLFRGKDLNKDQSYFLCKLNQFQLSKTIFPLGDLTKQEVRKIAKDQGLPVADKKDSQGICFVGKIDVKSFIEKELGVYEGNIIDIDTNLILGSHKGLWFYTEGQREGLGLGGGPFFVVKKDLDSNTLFVAKGKNNPHLFRSSITIDALNIINPIRFTKAIELKEKMYASLRYRQDPSPVEISNFAGINQNLSINHHKNLEDHKIVLKFLTPQRSPACGQYATIYDENATEIIASGVIVE